MPFNNPTTPSKRQVVSCLAGHNLEPSKPSKDCFGAWCTSLGVCRSRTLHGSSLLQRPADMHMHAVPAGTLLSTQQGDPGAAHDIARSSLPVAEELMPCTILLHSIAYSSAIDIHRCCCWLLISAAAKLERMLATARRSCSLLKASLAEGFLSSSQSPHSFKAKLSHELGFLSFTSSAEPQKQLVNLLPSA